MQCPPSVSSELGAAPSTEPMILPPAPNPTGLRNGGLLGPNREYIVVMKSRISPMFLWHCPGSMVLQWWNSTTRCMWMGVLFDWCAACDGDGGLLPRLGGWRSPVHHFPTHPDGYMSSLWMWSRCFQTSCGLGVVIWGGEINPPRAQSSDRTRS